MRYTGETPLWDEDITYQTTPGRSNPSLQDGQCGKSAGLMVGMSRSGSTDAEFESTILEDGARRVSSGEFIARTGSKGSLKLFCSTCSNS